MLDKVASNEGTGIHSLTVQSSPQNKEFFRPPRILAILSEKNMIGCEALKVVEDGIANQSDLGGLCLIWPPRTGDGAPKTLGV